MKVSIFVAVEGWLSTFTLAWLMILGRVAETPATWFLFAFFTIVAFIASVVANMPSRGSNQAPK